MSGPDWKLTAIFLTWDDWGGFYDHVGRRASTRNGYGLRVPGAGDQPVRQAGYIDHQMLSFDAYLKFIEDDFLGGQRLDPQTDGRPDPRPTVRENAADPRQPASTTSTSASSRASRSCCSTVIPRSHTLSKAPPDESPALSSDAARSWPACALHCVAVTMRARHRRATRIAAAPRPPSRPASTRSSTS